MTASWSTVPFGRSVTFDDLGPLGKNISGRNGECLRVCHIEEHPGWLFKEYQAPLNLAGTARLDRLVNLPSDLHHSELTIVDSNTAWPASRVLDRRQQTVGVVIPCAPAEYFVTLRTPSGRGKYCALEVDLLALPSEEMTRRGVTEQDRDGRVAVCNSLAAVGALLEKNDLVYLDWSYANAFWSAEGRSAFVIDLDGSSFGARAQIQSNGFEDPLVPHGSMAGVEVDRYRMALLTARCLTGQRELPSVLGSLTTFSYGGGPIASIAGLLLSTLSATTSWSRSAIGELQVALAAFGDAAPLPAPATTGIGGVAGWKPIQPSTTRVRPPSAAGSPRPPRRSAPATGARATAASVKKAAPEPPVRPPNPAPPAPTAPVPTRGTDYVGIFVALTGLAILGGLVALVLWLILHFVF